MPWFAALVLFPWLLPSAQAAENLLTNGNFETWDQASPSRWIVRSKQEITASANAVKSLQVKIVAAQEGKSGEIIQVVPVATGKRYQLSGQVRGSSDGIAMLEIKRFKGDRELDRTDSAKNKGSGWTRVEKIFESGDADSVEVLLRWRQTAADVGKTANFSGIALEEIGDLVYQGAEVPPLAVPTFNCIGLY